MNYSTTINAHDHGDDLITQLINNRWIISNGDLVHALLAKHGIQKLINNLRFTFSCNISCPNCQTNNYTNEYAKDIVTFKHIVENSFPEILQNIQPDQQIFGLNIVALPSSFL